MVEGTACLRFGQSCLSMTVNPNANKMEKEQAEMRAMIQEQVARAGGVPCLASHLHSFSSHLILTFSTFPPHFKKPRKHALSTPCSPPIAHPSPLTTAHHPPPTGRQIAEINELQSENQELKRLLEEKTTAAPPEFMVAKYIEVNKDALREDIREQAEQIDELRAALQVTGVNRRCNRSCERSYNRR